MMKVRISMPGAYMVMDMEEGQARTASANWQNHCG